MGKTMMNSFRGMGFRSKAGIVVILTLLVSIFMFDGWLKPLITDSATNTYYFTLDGSAVNLGADGSTDSSARRGGKISMAAGTYNSSKNIGAAANTNWQVMQNIYGPAYASAQTLSAPALTIGTRDYNATGNAIYWKADVYDYDPGGAAGNGVLLWSTTGTDESHANVASGKALTFSDTSARNMEVGHRLKVVVSCRMTSTNSGARLYFGSSTNYAFMTVTEAPTAANTVTVTNLADYNGGMLASVLRGEQGAAMLRFDLYANGATFWTGGKLDKIGSNSSLGDVAYSIYRDTNANGSYDAGTDLIVGGPYAFSQASNSAYSLTTPQTLSATPQRYFVVYDISTTAATATTVGARIANSSYFTVTNGLTVATVASINSSLPVINGTGVPTTKTYAADWDTGTTLLLPEAGGPTVDNSVCNTQTVTEPAGTSLVGLLNFPGHTCASVSGRYHVSSEANPRFVTLYFNGPAGYTSDMAQVKGISFKMRVRGSNRIFTVTLFYVRPDGVRVNAPVSATYSPTSASTVTLSLAGQTFTNVPNGSRLGVQIGVNAANAYIGLGSAVDANLVVEETSGANSGIDIGTGRAVPNGGVWASTTDSVVDSFTLSSPLGNQTVSSITISGNVATSSSVSQAKLYLDQGTMGVLDPSDLPLGTATFSGTSATFTGLSQTVGATMKNYLVAYDISPTPGVGATLTCLVTGLTGTANIDSGNDATSATLTIYPTIRITNGSSEPPAAVIPSGGGATNLDAFGLSINGGANDPVNTVTVSLAPAGISALIAAVEIVDRNSGAIYGSLSAPTSGDNWRVSTAGLYATTATTECYARIVPKADILSTYTVSGLVTAITQLQSNSSLIMDDATSAFLTLDGEPPTNPVLTATTGISGGQIQLNWTAANDASGLHPVTPYRLVRGPVNAPAPVDCSGSPVYQGTARAFTDYGLAQGQSFSYRVCSVDLVNNISTGTTASANAMVTSACNAAPTLVVSPSSGFVKAGGQRSYEIILTNNDLGSCANIPFTLTLSGTENSASFVIPSTLTPSTLTLAPNGGGASTVLKVTARATAPQGAVDTVTVVVSAAGHPTVNSTPVSTTVNDSDPLIHNSLNLGNTKYGDWGLNYVCTTCHYPKSTNVKRVKTVIPTPTGDRPVVLDKISSAVSTTGVLGNDQRATTTTSRNVCEVCHHQTRFHRYSSSTITMLDHNNGRDCMACHPHRAGFKYSGGAQCDDCHGNPPTSFSSLASPASNALGALAPNAGAHATHAPLMGCFACHNGYSTTQMGNKLMEMGFRVDASTYPGFTGSATTGVFTGTNSLNAFYRWTTSSGTTLQKVANTTSCSVYCHGWSGGGGSNPVPSWVGASQTACGTCHNATGLNPPASGSHIKHAGNTGLSNGILCTRCHATYTNYSTPAHINGNVEWNLSAVSATAAYRGANSGSTGANAPTKPADYGSCTNVVCHSNVQGATNASLGTGGPYLYATPQWGTSVTCGDCHVNMATNPSATGGHVQHAQNPDTSFECRICHNNAGTTTPSKHANGNIDISFSGVAVNTVYSQQGSNPPGNGYGTCSSSNCHGRQTLTWGPVTARPLCEKCHGSAATAGFYGTAGPGSTTANTDPAVGAHSQHIRSAPYNYATASDCDACHMKPAGPYSPGHVDTALPAEAVFGTLATRGSFFGYTSAALYNPGTRQCANVWCHGAGMDSNTGKGAYASVVLDGGTLPVPAKPTWNTPYLTGVGNNDCTRCHGYPPPAPVAGYTHYGKLPADCNGCHNNVNTSGTGFINPALHINGNIDGGCISCHANPPIDAAGLVKPALNAMNTGNVGAHNAHQLNPNIGSNCATCHNAYTTQMPSNTMQMGFSAYGGKVTTGTFTGYSSLTGNILVSSSIGTVVRRTNDLGRINTCSVYCHGGGTGTKPAIGGGSLATPNWELGYAEVDCGACHGVSLTSVPTAGSHNRHALAGGTGLGLTCDLCHGAKVNNYHVNGSVEWHLKLADPRMGTLARYNNLSSGGTNALAPSTTFASCSNLYCHSNVQGATGTGSPTAYTTQQWGVPAPLGCAACHKDMATDAAGSGSHPRHARTQVLACSACHNGAGSGTARHGDHSVDLAFNGTAAGTVYTSGSHAAGSIAYGTCSASYCHSNVQGATGSGAPTSYKATPAWGNTASLACSACHGDMTASGTGNHLKHTAKYGCATCHNGAGSGTTLHADGYIDVAFSGTGSGSVYTQPRTAAGSDGFGTCSSISCHYNGSATWGGGTLACTACHPLATLQASGAHAKHISTVPTFYVYTANRSTATVYDFGCSNCHPLDPANHGNAGRTIYVTLNKTNSGAGGSVGTLRAKNSATADGLAATNGPSGIYGTTRVSVRCSASYCHSNGYSANLKFSVTPDWYGPAYTGDKCAMCHGNSPNANDPVNQPGSPAHYSRNLLGFSNNSGGHGMGIHTRTIFSGGIGLAPAGNTATGSHGNPGTSTTINCNMCHYATVTSFANDRNLLCVKCHTTNPKNPAELITNKRLHISGSVDVSFNPIRVKSRAQLRNTSYASTIWSRQAGYKVSNAYDVAFKTFTTATQWNGTTKTCSNISCHNGKSVIWTNTNGATTCLSCHDSL